MTRKKTIGAAVLLTLAAVATLAPGSGEAQTIRQVSLYADLKARDVGDIVTVAVVERSSGSNSSSLNTNKSTKFNVQAPEGVGPLDFISETGASADWGRQHTGSGQLSRQGRLTATVAATVVEVLPNGDLVIEGEREVGINEEKEILSLRGVVRPEDIGSDNLVYSSNIANASIEYRGKGAVTSGSRPNIFVRILSWFF